MQMKEVQNPDLYGRNRGIMRIAIGTHLDDRSHKHISCNIGGEIYIYNFIQSQRESSLKQIAEKQRRDPAIIYYLYPLVQVLTL